MGLHVSHDCWYGGYMSFGEFRRAVAAAIGVPLLLMEGYTGGIVTREIDAAVERQPEHAGLRTTYPIRWDVLQPDALHVLLNHSDCEGVIEVADQLPLAKRLEEVAPSLSVEHRAAALLFACGLRRAAERGEQVQFG